MMKAILKAAYPYQQDKLNLPVKNLESALPFYKNILGFQIVSREDSSFCSAILERDELQIGLAENGGDPTQDGCFFEVDNVENAFAEFQANGLSKKDPKFETQRYGNISYKVFFVVAPDELCYCFGERRN